MTNSPSQSVLANLLTESRNPRSETIDQVSTTEMLTILNDEDATVAAAVRAELPAIAEVVNAVAERFGSGGRLFYMGAGTSGRLGVLDASECPPTFSVPASLVQGLIAGGDRALRLSSEHSEDSAEDGAADLERAGFAAADTLVGIAASGRTPYVLGALEYANKIGALTVALTCVPESAMAHTAKMAITPATGPEVITGSTRMKAGTATKMVLNMISTGVMIRTGAVYGNLMVNMKPTNRKLIDRAQRIIAAVTGCDRETAERLLGEGVSVKTAIVMKKLGVSRAEAERRLMEAKGVLRGALDVE